VADTFGGGSRPLVALTGATGFIGQHLLRELPKRGYRLRVLLRRPSTIPLDSASAVIGDLARAQNMSQALAGVDAVIHSAGIAHAMSGVPEDDYRLLNTEATIRLAQAAQRAGARRFVFLSSIRAQCGAVEDAVQTESLEPKPVDAYGRSKLAAEQGLATLDIDWVVSAPAPLRRPLLVADPEPVTLPEMVAAIRRGLGRRPGLIPVPSAMLAVACRVAGRDEAYRRLAGSLVADSTALRQLGWAPSVTTPEGLASLMR
jgi:nucleoside-diphosphate-sugar epimerase